MTDGAAADDDTGDGGSDGSGRDAERDDDAAAESNDEVDAEREGDANHLDDVADGAGCAEIWERLSERREE